MSTKESKKSKSKPSASNGKPTRKELEQLVEDLRWMYRIREFEDQSMRAFRNGLAGGYLHVYTGMEAVAIGWIGEKREDDPVIAAYRDHAYPMLMGVSPYEVMCEIMGRRDGTSKGKGGSMHLYSAEKHFFGGWGIVGGHTAMGAGLAFAIKYRGEDRVALCFYGDGAANAGIVYEAMNMASLWDLPVVFLIENNQVAMGTRLEYHAADPELHKRAVGFGIEHERVDGMDVIQVRKDAARILDYVRKNQRPYVVEVMTYRFAGHGAADHDQSLYRSKEEVEQAKKRDPILLLSQYLLKHGAIEESDLEQMQKEAEKEMAEVYEKASAAPKPDPHEVYEDVYTDMQPEEGH